MRKAQKKQAEDFIALLEEAHGEIKKSIDNNNNATAAELLEQCQEGALHLGNLIEKFEGEQFVTIGLIEEYCEFVYCIYEEIQRGSFADVNKRYKHLRKLLLRIENSVKNDIKIRTEAVFLPYKASMWDSLESVWRAAEADPDCDAYVIPIPYYDKHPNGSFGEKHYEADLYPEYVPITQYGSFDFEGRHPDMIFIHNPYDDTNYVTSIPPFFFSENLKKYTDNLIYIPYFILDEISPNNQAAVENMEHFCIAQGVVNADKVIVQSEEMRQIYINVLTKYAGEQTRNYWDKKILGLGSPKIDKVLNTTKSDVEIPEEWMNIIRKPDGNWKKIILYNTSVGALLLYKEQMLEKMETVFRSFKEKQSTTVLLWRPHPLLNTTIHSMLPHLVEKYQDIVIRYTTEGWGIYDDSPDVNRAIALSDAYYGDRSSVLKLYNKTGKPIMISKY